MQDEMTPLLHARTGHFLYESGHHGELWLDLDELWTLPGELTPYLASLAERLSDQGIDVICGPMTGGAFVACAIAAALGVSFCYTERILHERFEGSSRAEYLLPLPFHRLVDGRRVAVVDDVVNAGSATSGTMRALTSAGARISVIGALLVLGDAFPMIAATSGIDLVSVATLPARLWLPEDCPLCADGLLVDSVPK